MLQPWPDLVDYQKALGNPKECFYDTAGVIELQNGIMEDKIKNIIPFKQGAFAQVYKIKVKNIDGIFKEYAVKCFKSRPKRFVNQSSISDYLKDKKLDFITIFETDYEIEIQMDIKVPKPGIIRLSCPLLVTSWINGDTLYSFLEEKNLSQISTIAENFLTMILEMEKLKIAHGDLHPNNIIILDDNSLKLIDYDGMYVPALKGEESTENGSRHYQHPLRYDNEIKIYDETMDRFSSIVIYLSLLVLHKHPDWFKKYHKRTEENILFRYGDFKNPGKSKLFKEISQINDPNIKILNAELQKYCESKKFNNFKAISEILFQNSGNTQ